MNIETLMRAQAQVPIATPPFPTYDRCQIVHGPGECTIDDKLVVAMLRGGTILIICTPKISIKDRASSRIRECLGLNPCKIKGLGMMRDNLLFKKP
ncbi:hypothetical protein HKD37_01G000859 [Glycine soja]